MRSGAEYCTRGGNLLCTTLAITPALLANDLLTVALFRRLSSEAEILHNDENVGRNIMTDARGRFFLIDFGFSSTITAKQRAKSGPLPNLALLSRVDALLAKDARVFAPIVRAYEAEHGVRIDARYWGKQAGKACAAKLVAKLRAKAAAR